MIWEVFRQDRKGQPFEHLMKGSFHGLVPSS